MEALPSDLALHPGEHLTGLICPDCGGNLVVVILRESHLHFRCRVGHAYALIELLAAKEERLEAALWKAVYCFEEMAALLEDLVGRPHTDTGSSMREAFTQRRDLATDLSERLRQIIAADRPLANADPVTQPEPKGRP